jgi:hypothetical protein
MSHRSRILSLVAVSVLALTACGSDPQTEETTEVTTAAESATTSESTTEEVNADRKIGLNEPLAISCGGGSDEDCMTVTFTELNASASCPEASSLESRFVSLSIEWEMPEDADPDFTSPFRSSPWAAVTEDDRRTTVLSEVYCHGGYTESDLLAVSPGYSATGVAYLPVPDNTREIHFAVARDEFVILPLDLADAADTAEEPGAPEPHQPGDQAPVATAQPSAPVQAPIAPQPTPAPAPPPAEAPAAPSSPVLGFTGAPGADSVRELDKSIASCGDPSMHQTGTTFFTDGTSGWTQHCSDQMLGG